MVGALARGDQTVILRKGGIHERFAPSAGRFWLFPTSYHQQLEKIRPGSVPDGGNAPAGADPVSGVAIGVEAEVAGAAEVEEWERVERLADLHILRRETVRERFERGGRRSVHAMLVRIRSLERPVAVPWSESYRGCLSWVELETPMPREGLEPALDPARFEERAARFRDAVG